MTVKEHYDKHLAHFYSWMLGDFEDKKDQFLQFCGQHDIKPVDSGIALDLGAGNGVQTVALAELGYKVKAIDFNDQLLAELHARKNGFPIEIIKDDIKSVSKYKPLQAELIVCCGDTITHLDSIRAVKQLLADSFSTMSPNGKIILTFRDYSRELNDTARFIPVKSDDNRILTCFLEYLPHKVRVTDIFHKKENGEWKQEISSYEKVRVSHDRIVNLVKECK